MINITQNKYNSDDILHRAESMKEIKKHQPKKKLIYTMVSILIFTFLMLFAPWTQTIVSNGQLTTLSPDRRPQNIQTVIGGRIDKWYISEGQFVKKGDTIAFITEIKDNYFDPKLIERTSEQIGAKNSSMQSYKEKVTALESQINAMRENLGLKLKQNENKIKQLEMKVVSDSNDYVAAMANFKIAEDQYNRQEKLYTQGLRSLTDLENRRLKYQEAQAKRISAENKFNITKSELLVSKIELNTIKNDFTDKISKATSDKFSAISDMYASQGEIAKMENQLSNYKVRNSYYYITAPQDAYIVKAISKGVGETVKEGEDIVSIVPANAELAVEMFVSPVDMPLIRRGEKVRIVFDGWPTILINGWPNLSYGTFAGVIFAADKNISENGKFRILLQPDKADKPWPTLLKIGTGTQCIALLNDVPIWWELWRNLNGFPASIYNVKETKKDKKAKDEKK